MEYSLSDSCNYIHFFFEEPLIHNIQDIYFKQNLNIDYLNRSYLSYYYEKTINTNTYIFNGIFKDGYFLILIDIIDKTLNISIFDKHLIITKLNWEFHKYKEDLHLWKIKLEKNKKYEYFKLELRHYLLENNDINLEQILSINHIHSLELHINKKDIKKNNKIKSFLGF